MRPTCEADQNKKPADLRQRVHFFCKPKYRLRIRALSLQPFQINALVERTGSNRRSLLRDGGISPTFDFRMPVGKGQTAGAIMIGRRDIDPG